MKNKNIHGDDCTVKLIEKTNKQEYITDG